MTSSTLPTIFNYSNHSVRTVTREDKSIWFVAKDVFEALELPWNGKTSLGRIPESWRVVSKLHTTQKNQTGETGTSEKAIILISEPAVYKLAFRSNKPEAERFTEWVAAEVLPSIRKTGTYTMPETITPQEQHALSQAVKERSAGNGKLTAEIWSRIKNKFKVAKYNQLPRERFSDVMEYVMTMESKQKPVRDEVEILKRDVEYYKDQAGRNWELYKLASDSSRIATKGMLDFAGHIVNLSSLIAKKVPSIG